MGLKLVDLVGKSMTDNNENLEYDEEIEEIIDDEINPKAKKRKKTSHRKRNRNIAIFVIMAAIAAIALYFYNDQKSSRNEITLTSEEVDQNSYTGSNIMRVDLNQIKKINIDLATADLRIQKSNTNPYIEYTHLYRGEEDVYTLDVSYDNGELTLKSDIRGQELNMRNKIQIVRIFLPADSPIDEIKASVGAGDVKITDLEARHLDLKVKSGHISFENSFFGGAVSNEIGDIILNKTELLNTSLQTTVGDIIITDGTLGARSDFRTQSGDIIISADDSINNYNVRASLDVGNFILGNISYRNIKDGFRKESDGQKDIEVRTKVGDIIFNKGEGAILDEEEYITNETLLDKEEESEYEYINVEDSEEEEETIEVDPGDVGNIPPEEQQTETEGGNN